MPARFNAPELPYRNADWDSADLIGHGDRARKMSNIDNFLASEALDDTYKDIYRVLKQNMWIDEQLDTDEDKAVPAKKNAKAPVRKRAAPKAVEDLATS